MLLIVIRRADSEHKLQDAYSGLKYRRAVKQLLHFGPSIDGLRHGPVQPEWCQ